LNISHINYMDIKEEIFKFISTHEAIVSNDMRNRDEDIEVRFTTFGNRAGCKAIYDIIQILDDDTKSKVLELMRNKRVI
jgi:hypothetical protein